MAYDPTVFNQLFNFIPRHDFEHQATRLGADRYVKYFTAWQEFLVLLYAQATGKDTLREITTGLLTHQAKLYHLGLQPVPPSTLADALQRRDPALYESLFYAILQRVKSISPRHRFRFRNPLYTLDSTTIDLCLATFNWARFRTQKGAIKLHYRLDHAGHLPAFLILTDGKGHDLTTMRTHLTPQPDSIYCFDLAYFGLQWLFSIDQQGAFFVTRAKTHQSFTVTGQQPADAKKGILADQTIVLAEYRSFAKYPQPLRLITYQDPRTGLTYRFLTNHLRLTAATIAEIYHQRWQIELFFKWIKQNLKIKTFLGTSRNAVLTQVWVAMIYYLLLAYIKFRSRCPLSLTDVCRRVHDALMSRLDLIELLALSRKRLQNNLQTLASQQLWLFSG